MIDRIEKELGQKLGCEAVIHMDPVEVDNEKIAEIKTELSEKIQDKLPEVSIHDFRMVQGPTHTNLIFDVVVPYEYEKTGSQVKAEIEDIVSTSWENYFAVIHVDHSYV